MKKVILAVIMGLVVAGGIKEAGAAACCSGSTMGAEMAEGNHGCVSGEPGSKTGDAMMENPSEMAGHEGTMSPCDPVVLGNREATSRHSGPHPEGTTSEAQSPVGEECMTMTPNQLPRDGR